MPVTTDGDDDDCLRAITIIVTDAIMCTLCGGSAKQLMAKFDDEDPSLPQLL